MADAERRAILARRERFLRAALATAGVALAACDSGSKTCAAVRRAMPDSVAESVGCVPSVCLSIERIDAGPTVCLSAPIDMDAASPKAPDAATASDAGSDAKG